MGTQNGRFALSPSVADPLPPGCSTYNWIHAGSRVRIAVHEQGGSGPALLLLPALSTISSRREWEPFCAAIGGLNGAEAPRLISLDWPGFGKSERPHLAYDAALLARFLAEFRRDCAPADCGLIAAGHAAGIALLAAQRHDLAMREWVLVAPTWRGPFPTMAKRRSRAFALIRALVETPVVGPMLYRLNTSRSVLDWMSRPHAASTVAAFQRANAALAV